MAADLAPQRKKAATLYKDGNPNDAWVIYRQLLADKENAGATLANDLAAAKVCLDKLNQQSEFDALAEGAITGHPKDWQLLGRAAVLYSQQPHSGSITGGVFKRETWEGRQVDASERDRTRALQLTEAAMVAAKDEKPDALTDFLFGGDTNFTGGGTLAPAGADRSQVAPGI